MTTDCYLFYQKNRVSKVFENLSYTINICRIVTFWFSVFIIILSARQFSKLINKCLVCWSGN